MTIFHASDNTSCIEQQVGRRRTFWTTQPRVCGEYNLCDFTCAIPGLEYVDSEEPQVNPGGPDRTIKNTDWLESLILNILNTRARTDSKCPSPAAIFGHWSESYRGDRLYIGSTLWNAAEKKYFRNNDIEKAIAAAVRADMGKLTAQGLADSVTVEVKYTKRNSVLVKIVVTVLNAKHVLNLSGTFAASTWVWQ